MIRMSRLVLKALRVARERGLRELARLGASYVDSRAGVVSLLSPYASRVFRSIKGWREALDFLYSQSLLADLIRPMQIREELERLLEILECLRPRVIVEIGTARGGTLFLWTRVASRDALIASIDLPGGPFGGGYPRLKALLYKRFALPGQRIVLLRGDSHDPATLEGVKRILRGQPVDFLFIDGDHSYEGVRRDFEMYSQLVREGGLIVLHDIVPGPPSTWEACPSSGVKSRRSIDTLK